MSDRRIIYVLDAFDVPFGGVAAIYRHVEILHAHGMPASVALQKLPARDFYDTKAPLLIHDGRLHDHARQGDIFVLPESFSAGAAALAGTPAKRLMFCQNHHYLAFSKNPGLGIAEFHVDGVIASSEAIRGFFHDVYGIRNLPLLPYAIDCTIFKPAERKKRQIAFMPRKLPRDAGFLLASFRRRHPRHAAVAWVPIDKVTRAASARILAESDVFLSLSHRESFGLPPLEAMACGCLVAGFHGEGGREYTTENNGWWAETGDWKAAVDGLATALDLLDKGDRELDARRQAMDAAVKRYTPARLEFELLAFWNRELNTPTPQRSERFAVSRDGVVSIKFGP